MRAHARQDSPAADWSVRRPILDHLGTPRAAQCTHARRGSVADVANRRTAMRASFYERLSALDQSFLAFETPNASMHVALTAIFETGVAGDGAGRGGHRPHPPAHRRAPAPDAALPAAAHAHAGGGRRDLGRRRPRSISATTCATPACRARAASASCSAAAPRSSSARSTARRPLWEMWIIEGLSGGRFAMLAKVHHCMVDGIAGVDILAALLDTAPCRGCRAGRALDAAADPDRARAARAPRCAGARARRST